MKFKKRRRRRDKSGGVDRQEWVTKGDKSGQGVEG